MKRAWEQIHGRAALAAALAVAVGIAACTANVSDSGASGAGGDGRGAAGAGAGAGGTAPGSPAGDGWPVFGATETFGLRRLTSEQYAATVQTLLGVSTTGMPAIERVSPAAGFSAIGASTAAVSSAGVGQFEAAGRFLAQAAFVVPALRAKVSGCTPTSVADMTCFASFVRDFGQRAFRRPLTNDEVTRYTAAAAQMAMSTGDAWQALEAITGAFLQSPHFLYLTEVGEKDPANPARYRYTAYEMAARLSYFLTGNMPDDMLMAAAASGSLLTAAGVQAQVTRLLALPTARDSLRGFFGAMLSLDNLDSFARPTQVFPQFTPTLGAAMKQETTLVLDDLVFGRDGDYRRLFDQTETFVNAELASLYGLPAPAGAGFARTTLPASSHRAGLLGQAGVLAARDHSDGTSPTRRGLFVMSRLLCQNVPLAPPANLTIPPLPTGMLTARQRLEPHASDAVCAGCHKLMDPIGLSLEHFDAMGVYRDTDRGMPIDDTGVLGGKTYQGEIDLGAMLRDHPALGPCLVQALYGVGVGHLATEFDKPTFGAMVQAFAAGGARVRALLAAAATSDGFRYLPVPAP